MANPNHERLTCARYDPNACSNMRQPAHVPPPPPFGYRSMAMHACTRMHRHASHTHARRYEVHACRSCAVYTFILRCTENATEAWHRHIRQKQWHTQKLGPGCRRCQCPCGHGHVIIHTYIHTYIQKHRPTNHAATVHTVKYRKAMAFSRVAHDCGSPVAEVTLVAGRPCNCKGCSKKRRKERIERHTRPRRRCSRPCSDPCGSCSSRTAPQEIFLC